MTPTDDTLLTLRDACEIFFGGKVTPATLKAEHSRGNLALSKIGRAWFTTLADLRTMREKCRVEVQVPGSGRTKSATHGPSSMDEPAIAQGAALRRLSQLKQHFGITSRESTSPPKLKRRSLPT
jgi:hypothetical protein